MIGKGAIRAAGRRRFSGAAAYVAEGVFFDSTNDYLLTSSGLGATDNNTCLFSMWLYKDAADDATIYCSAGAGTDNHYLSFQIYYNADGTVAVRRWNGNYNPSITTGITSTGTMNDAAWNHILIARSGATYQIYINDVDATGATGQSTADCGHDAARHLIDGTPATPGVQDLECSEYYFTNEYLDISSQTNRRKFIDGSGAGAAPVDLGSDGSTPTGTQPLIYYKGAASVWNAGTNAGSGGNLTMTGAVTDSTNEPVEL